MLTCIFVVVSVIVVLVILYFLTVFISEYNNTDREEMSSYECGFEHHSLSRVPFSLRYYFLTMIFLVFDIEIIFLLYLPYNLIGVYSFFWGSITSIVFVVMLFLGLLYEWNDGSLDWVI